MTGDKLFTYLFGLNFIINVILIKKSEQRFKYENKREIFSRNFWQGYLYFIPFFITQKIIKEIEIKKENQLSLLNRQTKEYQMFIDTWKTAADELNLSIHVLYTLHLKVNCDVVCPIFIDNFGSKLGMVVFSLRDNIDYQLLKQAGYYCFLINPSSYLNYNKELFIETFNEFEYYGNELKKPEWYTALAIKA